MCVSVCIVMNINCFLNRVVDVVYGYIGCISFFFGLFDCVCVLYGGLKKKKDGSFIILICGNNVGGEGFCNGDMSV